MSLANLLEMEDVGSTHFGNSSATNDTYNEARILKILPQLRDQIAFYRVYPDIFVDTFKGPDCKFHFLWYQRLIVRVVMRYKYSYLVFPRAAAKSFLAMLCLMLKCILYPGAELFVTTGGKEQAASITLSKVEELCRLIPFLKNELDLSRGKTKTTKQDVKYIFKNGSKIDILAARQSSRGQRRHAGLIEECVLVDGDILNEVILPTTNVDRLLADGKRYPEEVLNKSQTYITSAGDKSSYAYQRLIEILVMSIVDKEDAFIMGGTYNIPVAEGLLTQQYVDQLKMTKTFSEAGFLREYGSVWSGAAEGAFFSAPLIDKHRVLKTPEDKYHSVHIEYYKEHELTKNRRIHVPTISGKELDLEFDVDCRFTWETDKDGKHTSTNDCKHNWKPYHGEWYTTWNHIQGKMQ